MKPTPRPSPEKCSFAGDKPAMKNIDMSANPACARAHAGAPQKSEEVVVNDNGTLKNVFVWVKAGVPDRQWPVPGDAGGARIRRAACTSRT